MCFVFFLSFITVWECNLQCSKQQSWIPAEQHYKSFWHIFGWHSAHVCLCFSFQDWPMQHVVGKVLNQRLKWYKTHFQLVLLKGRYNVPTPEVKFPYFLWAVYIKLIPNELCMESSFSLCVGKAPAYVKPGVSMTRAICRMAVTFLYEL